MTDTKIINYTIKAQGTATVQYMEFTIADKQYLRDLILKFLDKLEQYPLGTFELLMNPSSGKKNAKTYLEQVMGLAKTFLTNRDISTKQIDMIQALAILAGLDLTFVKGKQPKVSDNMQYNALFDVA